MVKRFFITSCLALTLGLAFAGLTCKSLDLSKAKADAPSVSFDFENNGYYLNEGIFWKDSRLLIREECVSGTTHPTGAPSKKPTWYGGNIVFFRPARGVIINKIVVTAYDTAEASRLMAGTFNNATYSANSYIVTITPTDGMKDFYVIPSGNVQLHSMSYEYSTYNPEASHFELVTDATKLTVGTRFILVGQGTFDQTSHTEAMFIHPRNAVNTYLSGIDGFTLSNSFNTGSYLVNDYGSVMTLGGRPGAWTINYESLQLNLTSGSSEYSNDNYARFRSSPLSNSNTEFSIESSNNDNSINISGIGDFSNRYIKYNDYSSDYRFFGHYVAGVQNKIYMFAQIAEPMSGCQTFANTFLNSLSDSENGVCDYNGNTDLAELRNCWSDLADAFEELTQNEKDQFIYGYADENGNDIQKTLALYDYICNKYNTELESSELSNYNFMGRSLAGINNSKILINKFGGSTIVTITILSLTTLLISFVPCILIIKRKRR